MGMYDYFEPQADLACPKCDGPLAGFQGKDGPCRLLVWEEAEASPTNLFGIAEELRWPEEALSEMRLPARFEFYTSCERCRQWVDFTGFCVDGVWNESVLGRHLSSGPTVPAWSVAQDWRQCSRCTDAWNCSDAIVRAGCPGCGALTRLQPA